LVWDSYQHLMTVGEQKSVKLIWMPAHMRWTTKWKNWMPTSINMTGFLLETVAKWAVKD
jgi:hypothetical protein